MTDNYDWLFPKWDEEKAKDSIGFYDRRTFVDHNAVPEELRTKASYREDEDGGFCRIEPVTVLRKADLGIVAEIVRISYWIAIKEDGGNFYQVNLIHTHPIAFDKIQTNTISVELDSPTQSGFEQLFDLLNDVRRYLEMQKLLDWQAKRLI